MIKQKFIGSRYLPKLKFISTSKIKEILDNDGVSHTGTDYGAVVNELQDILNERQALKSDIQLAQALKQQSEAELKGGKACKKCGFTCSQENMRTYFYQSPINKEKFRTKCKKCITEENKTFNQIRRTEVPF